MLCAFCHILRNKVIICDVFYFCSTKYPEKANTTQARKLKSIFYWRMHQYNKFSPNLATANQIATHKVFLLHENLPCFNEANTIFTQFLQLMLFLKLALQDQICQVQNYVSISKCGNRNSSSQGKTRNCAFIKNSRQNCADTTTKSTNHNLRIIKDSFLWDERSGSTIQLHMVHQFRIRDEPLWERFYWFV